MKKYIQNVGKCNVKSAMYKMTNHNRKQKESLN